MPSEITISLSPVLSQWVDEKVAHRGFSNPAEFVNHLVEREYQKELGATVNRGLTKAMESLVSEMTPGNWSDIRKAGRSRAGRRLRD